MDIDIFEEIKKYYQIVENIDISDDEVLNVFSTTFVNEEYNTSITIWC